MINSVYFLNWEVMYIGFTSCWDIDVGYCADKGLMWFIFVRVSKIRLFRFRLSALGFSKINSNMALVSVLDNYLHTSLHFS